MKLLPKFSTRPRHFRRFILTATILPAALASSVFGANWSGLVNLDTASAPDDIHVMATSTVTLSDTGGGPSITENSLYFEPVASAGTLTVNGAGLTLRSLATVLSILNNKTITVNGTADFAPGALYSGPTIGTGTDTNIIFQKNGGAGTLILDNPTNVLSATTTLKVLNGRLSIVGDGPGTNPISSLVTRIAIGSTGSTQAPILRFGSSGVNNTTFLNEFNVANNGTIEHVSNTTDTISNALGSHNITDLKTLTVNVAAGGLIIDGTIGNLSIPGNPGGSLTKTGAGTTLTLPGSVFVTSLTVAAGNVDIPGRLRTPFAPVISSGATLTLRNQSASLPNGLPATVNVPVGGTLEGLPGAFTVSAGVQSTLNLTGGTLNLGIGSPVPGLTAHLYTGNDAGANLAFNTFANFSTYFAGRGPGLVTSTGANAYPDLNFGSGFGNAQMYAPIAPTFTATDNIVSRFNGKISIATGGFYTFATDSDDGSMLYIDGATVVANNFYQPHVRRTGTVCLAPGTHDIEIGFYEGGGANGLIVDYSGPDTGNAPTTVPNSVLIPGESLTFLNPITVTASSIINTTAASVASTTFSTTGKVLNVNGYALDLGMLTLGGGGGIYTINVSTPNAEVVARSIADSNAAVSLVNNGPGTLILESGAAAQLVNGVAVTSNALGVVLGGAGGSPTGNAAVNVNGGSLTLSSKGGDQSYTPVGLSFTNGGTIFAAQTGTGVAGTVGTPIRTTLTPALTVNNASTLSLASYDNYILRVAGVSGGGSVSIVCGTVESSAAVSLTGTGQLSIANSKVSTQAGASAGAITVADSTLTNTGTLTSANSLTVTKSTLSSTGNISAGPTIITDSTVTGNGTLAAAGTLDVTRSTVTRSGVISSTGAMTVANSPVTSGGLTSGSTMDITTSTVTSNGAISAAGALTSTDSTITANAGASAASITVTNGKLTSTGALATGVGGITLNGGSVASTLELHGGSISGGPITATGGIIHVTSGLTTASTTASFIGFNPTGLKGRFILTGGHGQISRGDTQSGILTIATGTNGLAEKVLNQPLNFPQDADIAIENFFGNGIDTENPASGFAMGFFGNFTAPTTGIYTLQTGLNDDDAGFWVDLDGDGVFEGGNAGGTPGANGNELIAWASCCGDGAGTNHPGPVTLVGGQTYKVGIAVEDGQGGSGLVGRVTAPGGSVLIVDPSSPGQAGWWSYGLPNQVIVDAGAELDIQALNGSVNVLVNGHLELDGASSSTINSLVIGNGGIVEVGSGPPSPAGLAASLPVPEPGAPGLVLAGVFGLLGRRQRARRD